MARLTSLEASRSVLGTRKSKIFSAGKKPILALTCHYPNVLRASLQRMAGVEQKRRCSLF